MRNGLVFLGVLGPLFLLGCAQVHGPGVDGGRGDGGTGDGGVCGFGADFYCADSCESDALVTPECVDGEWRCRAGLTDLRTCPPGCRGGSPGPGCVCVAGGWECSRSCPDGINPWDPEDPASRCAPDGQTCTSGGPDACSSALSCSCEGGRWRCAIAEPDPVCWCGREPSDGDRCTEEGSRCGQCCPTGVGPTSWRAMDCVDGHWQPGLCDDGPCPSVVGECPVQTDRVIGTACTVETQICGNPCCGTAIECVGGVWRRGPEAGCACEPQPGCGPGSCTTGQYCRERCGPDDGPEYHCVDLADGCRDCSCTPVPVGFTCTVVGGRPFVSDGLMCG